MLENRRNTTNHILLQDLQPTIGVSGDVSASRMLKIGISPHM
jgi:hypothetical protein